MEASNTTQVASHGIFHIPELLIQIFLELPDKDLQKSYAVSSYWSKVLKAHLPPEKLPLPDGPPSPAYKKMPWPEMMDLLQLNPALESPDEYHSPLPSDTSYLNSSHKYFTQTMTRIPWHDWKALRYSEDAELRNTYIATPVPPTAVEVRIEDGAEFWEFGEQGYNDILKLDENRVLNTGCMRIERE
jgi:hypothetical protein